MGWAFWSLGQDSVSVLFIGNSYTYVNDLPTMTRLLSESTGKTLTVGSKTNGGFSFHNQCTDPLTFSAMHQHSWDVVVLQGQSQEPSFDDAQVNAETLPYAEQLADSVYAIHPCSNVLYYMTWGRENGDPQWAPISTFAGMNERLYNAYLRMADSTDAMVSPVGVVWKYVRDHYPAIQLYASDGSHPTVAGSYLAACTFYTSLFRSPVSGASYTAGLDAQTAAQLQLAADNVVLDSLDHFLLHPVDEPVQAHFTMVQNGLEVQFTNTSTRGEAFEWSFGDGIVSTEVDPMHVYGGTGTYPVDLIASNSCVSDTLTVLVELNLTSINKAYEKTFEVLEYPDHFVVKALTKTLYYEIYDFDGKFITSDIILTDDFQQIRKNPKQGVILLKNERVQLLKRTYVSW